MVLSYLHDYKFYNAPINKDPMGKIIGVGKYAFLFGTMGGLYDNFMVKQPETVWGSIKCCANWTIPITAMACVGSATTYLAANIRNKDDSYNIILGAIAAAPIFDAWHKQGTAYTMGTLAFVSLVCAAYHEQVKHNKSSIPFVLKEAPRLSLMKP